MNLMRIQLERDIISAILNTGNYSMVKSILKPQNFMEPLFRNIYTSFELIYPKKEITIIEVTHQLMKFKHASDYKTTCLKVTSIVNEYSSLIHLKAYALKLLEISISEYIIQVLKDNDTQLNEIQTSVVDELRELFKSCDIDVIGYVHALPEIFLKYDFPDEFVQQINKVSSQVDDRCLAACRNTISDNIINELFIYSNQATTTNNRIACNHLSQLITELWNSKEITPHQLNKIIMFKQSIL